MAYRPTIPCKQLHLIDGRSTNSICDALSASIADEAVCELGFGYQSVALTQLVPP
jgi:hypothetical protein